VGAVAVTVAHLRQRPAPVGNRPSRAPRSAASDLKAVGLPHKRLVGGGISDSANSTSWMPDRGYPHAGMSGLELQAKLNAERCKIPIIFITAHGDAKMRMQALRAGAVEFLQNV